MNHDIDINKIYRYLAGECSAEERRHVRQWVEADRENRQAMDALRKIWEVQPLKEVESNLQLAWQQLEQRMEQRQQTSPTIAKKRPHRSIVSKQRLPYASMWLRVAALVVFGFLLALFFAQFKDNEVEKKAAVAMQEVVAKRGHQAELTFSDGTHIVLNAGSRIRFPERFAGDAREVFLEGEAYFEVAHKEGMAFIVQTKNARVKVLGTKFNVKARPAARQVEVAVARGKVAVKSNIADSVNADPTVILTKGQISTVRSGHPPTSPESIDIKDYLAWLRGDFVFDKDSFSKVLRAWERRFDVHFSVKDSSLQSVLFTGKFSNESLEDMLELTSRSLEFTYYRKNQTITILTNNK